MPLEKATFSNCTLDITDSHLLQDITPVIIFSILPFYCIFSINLWASFLPTFEKPSLNPNFFLQLLLSFLSFYRLSIFTISNIFPFSLKPDPIRCLSNLLQLNCPYQGHLDLSMAISNGQVSIFILIDQLAEYDHSLIFESLFHLALEEDLTSLPLTSLTAHSQSSLFHSLHLSDTQNLEYFKIQSLDLFPFPSSLTYLVSSNLTTANTIYYMLCPACISSLNSRLAYPFTSLISSLGGFIDISNFKSPKLNS